MTAAACYAPPRGNPGALRSAAAVWSAMGSELSTLSDQVAGAESMVSGSWKGAGANAFASASTGHANHLRNLAGYSSDMASRLSHAAQLIEHAQQVYKQQQQKIAAARAHASHGPSGLAIAGVIGAGALFVATSWIPGVDVGTGALAAGDAAAVAGDTAIVAAETAAVASEVSAATSVIGEAVATMTSGLEAIAQEIVAIGSRFAQAFGRLPRALNYGIQNVTGTAASEAFHPHVSFNGVIPSSVGVSFTPGKINPVSLGLAAAIGGASSAINAPRFVQYAVMGGGTNAAQGVVNNGSVSPGTVAVNALEGAGFGALEAHAQIKPAIATGLVTNTIRRAKPIVKP